LRIPGRGWWVDGVTGIPVGDVISGGAALYSISSTFYEQLLRRYSCAKKLQSQTVIEKSCTKKALSFEKEAH